MPAFANDPAWGPKGDPKSAGSWYPLLKAGDKALDDLLANWDSIVPADSSNGDAVRRYLGTVGVSSPLSAVKKAFVGIRDSTDLSDDVDIAEFIEAYEAVITDLSDAENDLYSSNFADFSGGGQLKGSNFIKKARKSVAKAKQNYTLALKALQL